MGALDEVKDLASAVADRRRLRLWDVQILGQGRRSVVRVLVDADGGVDLDTVAEVSEEISRGLDLRDPLPGTYTLEVSSPGLERSLSTPEHYHACVGQKVVVKTVEKLRPEGHRLEGEISSAGPSSVVLSVDDDSVEVPYGSIRSARTVFEWN
jgi:ribosome maturation factor RimP